MKKKKKHDKIVLWGKDNLNAIDASYINYDEFLFSKCPKRIEWDEKRNKIPWNFCVICYIQGMNSPDFRGLGSGEFGSGIFSKDWGFLKCFWQVIFVIWIKFYFKSY